MGLDGRLVDAGIVWGQLACKASDLNLSLHDGDR